MRILIATLILTLPTLARAADVADPSASHNGAAATTDAPSDPHPRVPDHPTWAKNLVITIAVMFLLAFVMGPIVRAVMPQEVEPPHAHDEHGGGAHDDQHAHGH